MIAYVTFGQKFRRAKHPCWPEAHPDGYWVVDGPSAYAIIEAIENACLNKRGEPHYSDIYWSLEELGVEHYPRGELGRMDV